MFYPHICTKPLILLQLYRNNVLSPHIKNNKYDSDFKIKVVKAYENGEGSFQDLAIKYGIPNKAQKVNWYHIY